MRRSRISVAVFLPVVIFSVITAYAANKNFHEAPDSAKDLKNPYSGQASAVQAGKTLYARNCLACHGRSGQGTGNIPSLIDGKLEGVPQGEVFWFITKGDKDNGMPSWEVLSAKARWELVSYVETMGPGARSNEPPPAAPAAPPAAMTSTIKAPPPKAPFTDFRYEWPGNTRKITAKDLPAPYATESAQNGPQVVARPENVWPVTLPGFKVGLYAGGLDNPRLMRTAPNGDIFLAEMEPGRIRVFRGLTSDGKPEEIGIFASGLHHPYGIAFYPPGPDPQWIYIGGETELVRFPYHNGDMKATGPSQHIADFPAGGHDTRAVEFSKDGSQMFVAVGSASNDDDTDTHPDEHNRADILVCDPANCTLKVYAYGIRNAGGGIRVNPQTGELWCSVNERDALGDNLVPDYITHVEEGGFYGWPWWYTGANQDPRQKGKHPELKDKVIVPDVLLQPHNASLEIAFYDGKQFPAEYQGDIFASEHGSWNKGIRAGYEVIRVPLHQSGHASGEYEDFVTGFVLPNGDVWGRPVGMTVAPDGSLLVSDDGSNSIWRVSYTGK